MRSELIKVKVIQTYLGLCEKVKSTFIYLPCTATLAPQTNQTCTCMFDCLRKPEQQRKPKDRTGRTNSIDYRT